MKTAILRELSSSINRCELTHLERAPIDIDIARRQHGAYERLLVTLGYSIIRLPEEAELPDAVFVEDAAVVLPELAIITRPGAPSRRPEVPSVAAALAPFRRLVAIESPGTVDGGDVLVVGKKIYVGAGGRSNGDAIDQVARILHRFGYVVRSVPLNGCLHLKSAATVCAPDTLLVNPAWVDPAVFGIGSIIEVHPSEPHAANALYLGRELIYPVSFPRTRERLNARGITPYEIDLSELAKAEGAVTCCSLIVEA